MHSLIRAFQILLLFSLISTSLLAPLSSNLEMPSWNDYGNHLASIIQARQALEEGQFPIRVAPTQHEGWRYPLYQFYAPSSYTFSALLYRSITPNNPWIAFKLTLIIFLTIGGIYMSRLARWFTQSSGAGLMAGVSFLISPYLILIIDRWGGFNEALAIALLPLLIYSNLQYYLDPNNLKKLLIAAFCWFLLITIHLITFVYTSVFSFLILFLVTVQERRWKNFFLACIAYSLGCLLALWFLAPVALMAQYLFSGKVLSLNPGRFSFMVPFSDLLAAHSVIVTSVTNPNFPMLSPLHPAIGWPFLIAAFICAYKIFFRKETIHYREKIWLFPLLGAFIIAFILVWSPFDPWSYVPKIFYCGQYCWRLLGQIAWLGPLLVAFSFSYLFKDKIQPAHIVIGILLITISSASWMPIVNRYPQNIKTFTANPLIIDAQNDYLINDKNFHNVLSKQTNSLPISQVKPLCRIKQDTLTCTLTPDKKTELIPLPALYYPQMLDVRINGNRVTYYSMLTPAGTVNRLVTAVKPIPNQENIISVRFTGLAWANWPCALAWVLFISLLIYTVLPPKFAITRKK